MLCPACKSEMIVMEYHRIELDYCPDCKGVWFDSTELDLLLKTLTLEKSDMLLHNLIHYPEITAGYAKRKCPICSKVMKLINVGDKTDVIIDICNGGDGLWFDNGEVIEMIKQLAKIHHGESETDKVFDFLGEAFEAN